MKPVGEYMKIVNFRFSILNLLFVTSTIMAQNRGIGLVQPNRPEFSNFYDHSYALVIGINKYDNVERLKYATNDAKSIASMLQTNFGFDPDKISLLLDSKADRGSIMRAFDRLRRDSKNDDRVFVFFAGHGMTFPMPDGRQKGYILPCDADPNDIFTTGISTDQLNEISQAIAAKHIFFVMDACYGGLIFSRAATISPSGEDYMKVMATRRARKALTAGGQDQTVVDTGPGGHSVFTYYLINGLTTGAADLNGDGIITSSEIEAYVAPRVTAETNSSQTPEYGILGGDMGGDFIFLPSNAVMSDMASATFGSNPDSALVTVDGKYIGMTPLTVPLNPGKHFMTMSKEGFTIKSDTILLAQNVPNSFSYVLPAAMVEVNVTTNVDTADLYVDRMLITRIAGYKTIVTLPAGTHTIEVKKDQFATASTVVTLTPGNPYTLPFLLDRVFTLLNVKLDPDSAAVYVDGALQLLSSGQLQIKTGSHKLTVKKEGFETLVDTVDVVGNNQEIALALVPIKESLQLTSSPSQAVVSVDGHLSGLTPSSFQIPYGTHIVALEKPGYKPVNFNLDVSTTFSLAKDYRMVLSTESVASEILKVETNSNNALCWTNTTLTALSGIGAIVVAAQTSTAYRNYMNATGIEGINNAWDRYRSYNVLQNAFIVSTAVFALASIYSYLSGADHDAAYKEAQDLDRSGLNFYDISSVDTCFKTTNPTMINLSGGYGYTPLPGKIVFSTMMPIEANIDLPLGSVVSLRLGGGAYKVWTSIDQPQPPGEDVMSPADSILSPKAIICGKVGLGFLIGQFRVAGDYVFPLTAVQGQPPPNLLFPNSLYEFTIQAQVLPGVYAGLGLTFFVSKKMWGVTYDQNGTATYDISGSGTLCYPNLVLGFEL